MPALDAGFRRHDGNFKLHLANSIVLHYLFPLFI